MSDGANPAAIDPRLLALLVCPVTRGRLLWRPEDGLLVSEAAGLAFRVVDGVPVMLPDEALAWPLPDHDPATPTDRA